MQESLDRAAIIEAASRNLRQQIARAGARDRPRSKGALHDGGTGVHPGTWVDPGEPRFAENAQRRIRSAENQHRVLSVPRDGPQLDGHAAPSRLAPQLDGLLSEEPETEDIVLGSPSSKVRTPSGQFQSHSNVPTILQEFHNELKRPLSRKKDPSASAAAGLGAFAGPARMTDAFELQKTRQPIPVESWGPRPPSRAGLPTKAAPLESSLDTDIVLTASAVRGRGDSAIGVALGRPASKVSCDQAKVMGGTWAAARVDPHALADARRGRERKPAGKGCPEASYPVAELGIYGSNQLSKSLSGSFDPQSSQCGSPPTRKGRPIAEAVSVEDIDADLDLSLGSYRRDATPPQVIVTRSAQPGKPRGDIRRGSDQRGARERDKHMPFSTSLDIDFLSLFAS